MRILHVISSPRGKGSYSMKLGNAIIEKLQLAHPGSTVKVHDLTRSPFPHLEEVHLQSFFTPAESRSPELLEAVKHSDEAIGELTEADLIVIDAPLYNFTITSTLKAWIDHIVRRGLTFKYDENGAEGLVKGKKVYLAISSGGIYSEGPAKAVDFVTPYLRHILGFIGLTDVSVFRMEGLNLPGNEESAVTKGLASIAV